MKIVHIQRRQPIGRFSIEGYFARVRSCLAEHANVTQYSLPYFSRGILSRLLNTLAAAVNQADINHVTGDIHYAAILLRRRRTVLTVHDCEILHRLNGWQRVIVRWLWYVIPASRVTAITVNSEETKRQLLKVIRFPEERIRVIPVSVSRLFQPNPKEFNQAKPRILQIGTKANKNIMRLAQALRDIPCDLEIVGPLNATDRQALADNHIAYKTFEQLSDEQIAERYRLADMVSFVSTHEGFGMPIVESQFTERVCITSNCSSMPEVAGQGAYLVDPLNVDSIRDGLMKIISDPELRNRLIARGRENRKRFDDQVIADEFLHVYREIYRESQPDSAKAQ